MDRYTTIGVCHGLSERRPTKYRTSLTRISSPSIKLAIVIRREVTHRSGPIAGGRFIHFYWRRPPINKKPFRIACGRSNGGGVSQRNKFVGKSFRLFFSICVKEELQTKKAGIAYAILSQHLESLRGHLDLLLTIRVLLLLRLVLFVVHLVENMLFRISQIIEEHQACPAAQLTGLRRYPRSAPGNGSKPFYPHTVRSLTS